MKPRRLSLLAPLLLLLPLGGVVGGGCEPPPPGEGEGEGDGEGEGPVECFSGDPNAEPEFTVGYRDVDGVFVALEDGGAVPMIFAPQARFAILLGARVRNMDMCRLLISAGVFDDCQSPPRVISSEIRGVDMVIDDATGFATPENPDTLNNYANLDLTFNTGSDRDIDDEPYRFQVRVTDRAQRTAVVEGTLVPVCAQAELVDKCRCEGDVDYTNTADCADTAADPDVVPGTCSDGSPLP